MHEKTLRVFSALRERARDEETEDYHTLNEIARDAGLSLDETARELDRLAVVGAVSGTDDDEMAYRPRDATVGTVADRLAAIEALPADRRDAVVERLQAGDVDPASLRPLVDALGFTDPRPDEPTDESPTTDGSDGRADGDAGGVASTSLGDRLAAILPGA